MKTELQKRFEEQTPTIRGRSTVEYLQTFVTWLHLQVEKNYGGVTDDEIGELVKGIAYTQHHEEQSEDFLEKVWIVKEWLQSLPKVEINEGEIDDEYIKWEQGRKGMGQKKGFFAGYKAVLSKVSKSISEDDRKVRPLTEGREKSNSKKNPPEKKTSPPPPKVLPDDMTREDVDKQYYKYAGGNNPYADYQSFMAGFNLYKSMNK